MKKIALCIELPPHQQQRLRDAIGPDELCVFLPGTDLSENCLNECEIVFGNPPACWLAAAPSLRWVQLESVGFGEYSELDRTANPDLVLTNLAGFFADPVAETALAGILALGRGIDWLVHLKDSKTWEGDPLRRRLRMLRGAHVVMVGYGAINQRLAELLAAFHCQITTIRSSTTTEKLDLALGRADIVVCTAPDSAQTRNLFDAPRLSLLPTHAIFANLGRGSIVDEMALVAALSEGKLAGAVLDVTRSEPLPKNHPLWACPNTLLTQHSGGGSADELDRKIDVFLGNLGRYRRGEPLQNAVDFKRGY